MSATTPVVASKNGRGKTPLTPIQVAAANPAPPVTPPVTVITPLPGNLKLNKASEIKDANGLNILIYGEPGAGKTTLAGTAAEVGKVLWIDVEGGTRSIADRADIDVFTPATFGEIKQMYEWVRNANHEYDTVVVDSITEAQSFLLREVLRASKTPDMPTLQDYGKVNQEITGLVRAFRMLAQTRGLNVIFIALAAEQKNELTGGVEIRPALQPKASEGICGVVDMLGYLKNDVKQKKRTLHLAPVGFFVAKIRQPMTGPQLPTEFDAPSLVPIIQHLKGVKAQEDAPIADA